MQRKGQPRFAALAALRPGLGLAVKVTDGFFLVGLANHLFGFKMP
jgi:hypothetical protein